jgi:hypothetical protein
MRTVRRLYVYLVTLISLELVIWGLINLLQNSLSAAPDATANLLASGLSLILVGLPFFLLHGWIAQREARRDPEEQNSRLRALFHYAARFALLSPVVLDLYHLLKELLQALFGLLPAAGYNAAPSPTDRLIAVAINVAAWIIFERLLRSDWTAITSPEAFIEVRRLSRYLWLLYGLGLAIAGVVQILQYLLDPISALAFGRPAGLSQLVSGLALTVVGVPLWVFWWEVIERTRDLPAERPSTLRWVVLYMLALVGALVALFAAQSVGQSLVQVLLGEPLSPADFLGKISQPLALTVVFVVLWAYYSRQVRLEWAREPDDLRRAGLRRLYHYPLALAGNAAVFAGAWQVLGQIVETLIVASIGDNVPRIALAGGIAWLLVGAAFWLSNWPVMQAEARRADDAGDHARRSVLRKSYLYLVVFLTVVGLMASAGVLLYRLINALLGNPGIDLTLEAWLQVRSLVLLAVWLVYHQAVLRADGRLALHTLTQRQANFSILILQPDEDPFYATLKEALNRQAPGLPVTVQPLSQGLPGREAGAPQALVLPAVLALEPSLELRAWLGGYSGRRVLVPLPSAGWEWAGQPARTPRELAQDTAVLLQQMSEGQSFRPATPANPWVIAGYVLGGLFALILALIFFSVFMSNF